MRESSQPGCFRLPQPFPLIDANDPDTGVKIIWNVMFRPMWTDDFDARYFECVEVYESLGHPYQEVDYQLIGHHGAYNSIGRTEVDPMPADPDYKISKTGPSDGAARPESARQTGSSRLKRKPGAVLRIRYKTSLPACCSHCSADTSPPSAQHTRYKTSLPQDFRTRTSCSALGSPPPGTGTASIATINSIWQA